MKSAQQCCIVTANPSRLSQNADGSGRKPERIKAVKEPPFPSSNSGTMVANGSEHLINLSNINKSANLKDNRNDGYNRNWNSRLIGRRGSARDTINMFNNIANKNKEKLEKNPFSESYTVPKYDTNAQDYGRPTRGSKTEARGIKAGDYIMREVLFLCEVINTHAEGEPPNRIIKFGPLFYIYAHYSDKLVGMLIRARKYKLVDFEGEMLYQRQDDDKIIRLLKPIEEIRKIAPSGDPVNCISICANVE